MPAYYDSLLAKVIAHGVDRDAALRTLGDALDRCVVGGVVTNLELLRAVVGSPGFADGGVDTGYLARWLADGNGTRDGPESPGTVHDHRRSDLDRGVGHLGVSDD